MPSWQRIGELGVLFLLLSPALKYGGIWNLRAKPARGVEVRLRDGRTERGALTRDWSGDWVLLQDAGGEIRFLDRDYSSMSFPRGPGVPASTWQLLWRGWRSFLPMASVLLAMSVMVAGWLRQRALRRGPA